jgi:transcriptional regulator with XRE-family HTH domain
MPEIALLVQSSLKSRFRRILTCWKVSPENIPWQECLVKIGSGGVDEGELGAALRARRKAAGRTIASVAVDAGLSVPYIANLENGRGNPTLAALDRLSGALGTSLVVALGDDDRAPVSDELAALVDTSARAARVIGQLASARGTTRRAVREQLIAALEALTGLMPQPPTEPDLNRLLDLLLLAD